MKQIKKYTIFTILIFFLLFIVSCSENNEENNDEKKNEETSIRLTDFSLSNKATTNILNEMKSLNYSALEFTSYEISKKCFNNSLFISSEKDLTSFDIENTLKNDLINKYKSSFFSDHALILCSHESESTFNLNGVYFNGNEIAIITENGSIEKEKSFIIELNMTSLDYSSKSIIDLIDTYVEDINVYTTLYFKAKSNNKNSYLSLQNLNHSINFNDKELSKEDANIFNKALSKIVYINSNHNTNSEPLFTISYGDTSLKIYDNKHFDIKKNNETQSAELITGSFLFALYYLDNLNQFSKETIDFVRYAETLNIFSYDLISKIVRFTFIANEMELPNDFNELSRNEKIDYAYLNYEDFTKEEKQEYKEFSAIYKSLFDEETEFSVLNYISAEPPVNSRPSYAKAIAYYYEDTVDIKSYLDVVPSNYLLAGWVDKDNNLYPIQFINNYYSDLTLYLKTVPSNTYTIADYNDGKIITSYLGNEETIYIPLFDENGNKITGIDANLFKDNKTIKTVYINDNIAYIGEHAFDGCENLETIIIGKNVTTIGDYAFANCGKLVNVTFEEGLTTLGNYMFVNCSAIKSISIPASMKDLKDHVFEGCTSIETFTVDENNETFYAACNNIMEGTTLYYGCKNSTIPDGTVFIREFAFYGVTGLEKIYIPSCVVHIDTSAFHNCSGLKEVYISQSVMWNATNAFNTGTNTIINCEYYTKMSGWVVKWTTGTTVNWNVPQPE